MITTSSSTHDRNVPARPRSRSRRARGSAVLAATGAGLLGWAVAGPLAGVHLAVRLSPGGPVQHVGAAAVAVAGLLAGLAAWALLAALERVTGRVRVTWTVMALIALAVSLAGPLAGVSASAKVALAGLHLLVAAVLITGLRRTAR